MSNEVKEPIEETVETKKAEKKTKKTTETKAPSLAPKLFFKADSRVEIDLIGYHSKTTGELNFVVPKSDDDKDNESLKDLFNTVEYKFWFTRVPYNTLNRYRTRSMIYNSEDQNNTINELRLREFFLVFHLVDWNLTDEDGKKIELKFDPNKALSDESLELIYTLPSSLLDTLLTTFEKRLNM